MTKPLDLQNLGISLLKMGRMTNTFEGVITAVFVGLPFECFVNTLARYFLYMVSNLNLVYLKQTLLSLKRVLFKCLFKFTIHVFQPQHPLHSVNQLLIELSVRVQFTS